MDEKQIAFLIKIGVNPDDDISTIEEEVGEYLSLNCLDENYLPNADGLMCESILDYISEQ